MPYPEELDYWTEELSTEFPQLSQPQVNVLALYSYGMAMTHHCGQTIITVFLALLLTVPAQNLRQRLREWNYEAEQKRGSKRQEIRTEDHFAPLLRFILGHWREKKRLVLAVDVTYLRDRHTVLTISVLYRGCAIPVAWRVLKGNQDGEWHPIWVRLLQKLRPAVPPGFTVLVLCDRGLYSKRLFGALRTFGWHPFMRIRAQGMYRRIHAKTWRALEKGVYRGMKSHCFQAQCFKGDPLTCTLWVQWPQQYDEPCLIVTDLSPKQVQGSPYALRSWIEAGFKDLKRGGFHWEQCKTTAPERMERLLLLMALAMLWLIRQGSAQLDELLHDPIVSSLSCPQLGWISTFVCAIRQQPLLSAYFSPYLLPPLPS
jgi:hypothetical protein